MSATELRKLSDVDLNKQLDVLAEEGMKLRFQKATMQLSNSARIKKVRGEIARIKTILTERGA
ncbi:MAG: 50S ribosomal protein L29 [Mariprofundaceae bacterium]|nr:50S ribosomal protein L29 [Mariprofundaceae bacterium]